MKLPKGWWVLGVDVQLSSDVDEAQVRFFRSVAAAMSPGDQIVLCTPEPAWIYSKMWSRYDHEAYNESNLAFLRRSVLPQDAIRVIVAGDLHHYRRHVRVGAPEEAVHKITAGGGGAFLHLTHGTDVSAIDEPDEASTERYELVDESEFPSRSVSRRLSFRTLLFPFRHPSLGALISLFHLLFWVGISRSMLGASPVRLLTNLTSAVSSNPGSAIWPVVLASGIFFFTDTHSRRFRLLGGFVHAVAQIACGVAAIAFAIWAMSRFGVTEPWGRMLVSSLLVLLVESLASGFVLGAYLFVSLNVFGRHLTEASSAVGSIDFKSFLRLKIDANGTLTLYPIGIERVPRRWIVSSEVTGPRLVPARSDRERAEPLLLEAPIVVPRRPVTAAPAHLDAPGPITETVTASPTVVSAASTGSQDATLPTAPSTSPSGPPTSSGSTGRVGPPPPSRGDASTHGPIEDPTTGELLAIGFGFALFGTFVGAITALSSKPGSGMELLTGSFAFVGGALLTYGGFQFRSGREAVAGAPLDLRKVGVALGCFSFGGIAGIYLGLRVTMGRFWGLEVASTPADTHVANPNTPTRSHSGSQVATPSAVRVGPQIQSSDESCKTAREAADDRAHNRTVKVEYLREIIDGLAGCTR